MLLGAATMIPVVTAGAHAPELSARAARHAVERMERAFWRGHHDHLAFGRCRALSPTEQQCVARITGVLTEVGVESEEGEVVWTDGPVETWEDVDRATLTDGRVRVRVAAVHHR